MKVENEMVIYTNCAKIQSGWCFVTKPKAFFEFLDDNYRLKAYKAAYKEARLIKHAILKLIKMTKLK